MNTLEEQYQIQWQKTKKYWRRKRIRNAIIFAVLEVILIIMVIYFKNDEYWSLAKYPFTIIGIFLLAYIVRELIMPLPQENAELKHLNEVYQAERFKERNG